MKSCLPSSKKLFLALLLSFGFLLLSSQFQVASADTNWIRPTGFEGWQNDDRAYDGNTATYAETSLSYSGSWTPFLELTYDSSIYTNKIRFYQEVGAPYYDNMDIDVYQLYDGTWYDVYEGSFATGGWVEKNIPGGARWVRRVRVRLQVGSSSYQGKISEFQLWDNPVWRRPAGSTDWTDEEKAYDGYSWTSADVTVPDGSINGSWLELFLDSPITSDRIRFSSPIPPGAGAECPGYDGPFAYVAFQIYKDGAWDPPTQPYYRNYCWDSLNWSEVTFPVGSVSRLRFRFSKFLSAGSPIAAMTDVEFGEFGEVTPCTSTVPGTPELFSPPYWQMGVSTSPTVSWKTLTSWGEDCGDNDDDDYFQVFLDKSTTGDCSTLPTTSKGTVPRTTTSMPITGLDYNSIYCWRVRAFNGARYSEYSATWPFQTESAPVPPSLNVSPTTVNLSATQGTGTITCGGSGQGACPSVWNTGGGTLSWTTSPTSPDGWLSWIPASGGNGPTTLWVSATINGLAAGSYSKTVTVSCNPLSSCQGGGQQRTVTVNLTVTPAPVPVPAISRDPTSKTFVSITEGDSSAELFWLDIWNSGEVGSTLNWTLYEDGDNDRVKDGVSDDIPWVRARFGTQDTDIDPYTNTGDSTGLADKDTVTVGLRNTQLLAAGSYSATLVITDPAASIVLQTVTLNLTVREAPPYLNVSPTIVNLSATEGMGTVTCGGSGQGACPSVWNTGGGTLSWSTSPTSPDGWLSWTPTSHTGNSTTLWVSATINGLAAGNYQKQVTVSCSPQLSSCQSGGQQRTVTVNLTICANTAPSVTTLSLPANGGTGQSTSPTVSWNTVSAWGVNCAGNNNTYTVYLDTSPNPATNRGSVPAGTTSLAISGLSNGTTYYWKVRASNGVLSTDSAVWSFTTAALPYLNVSPTTVNLSATQGTGTVTCGGSGQGACPSVWNTGGGTLSWSTSPTSPDGWLSWTPTSHTGNSTTLWVSATINGLAAGNYQKQVTVSCSPQLSSCQSGGQQRTVTVNLTVTQATASISGAVWLDTGPGALAGNGVWDTPDESAYTYTDPADALTVSRGGGNTVDAQSDGSYDFGSFSISPPESVTVSLDTSTLPSGWGGTGVAFSDGTACGTASTSCLVTLNNGDSKIINFGIWGIPGGWFQVIDGDVHAEQNIQNNVP